MSDDNYIPSGTGSADNATGESAPALRVAILSRTEGAADALWDALKYRAQSRNRPLQGHANRADADIVIYLPAEEDFASENAAQSFEADIARDAVAEKLVIEPMAANGSDAKARMMRLRDSLTAQGGIEWVAANAGADDESGAQRSFRHQARQIARILKEKSLAATGKVEGPEAEPLREEQPVTRAEKKGARREGRAKKDRGSKRQRRRRALEASTTAPENVGPPQPQAEKPREKRSLERKTRREARAKKERGSDKQRPRRKRALEASTVSEKVETPRPKAEKPREKRSLKREKEAQREATAKEERQSKRQRPKRKGAIEASAAMEKKAAGQEKVRRAKQPASGAQSEAAGTARLPTVSIALSGLGDEEKAALMESLRNAFRESGARVVEAKPSAKARISVHAFDRHPADLEEAEHIAQTLASTGWSRILLDRTAPRADAEKKEFENPAIARASLLCSGALLDMGTHFGRHGIDAADTEQRAAALALTAALIAREAANNPKLSLSRQPLTLSADVAEALRLADAPLELLSKLTWSSAKPPRVLHAQFTQADVENFADRKIALSDEDVRDVSGGVGWQSADADARAQSRLFGLGFLIAPLSYWYSKASDRKSAQLGKIDASLKQRGVTASAILGNAGDIIRDFAEKMPLQASSPAWQEQPVSTRIRALTLYILCCKLAVKRRIKFDDAVCGAVFRSLIDHIEFLRSGLTYKLVSAEGVERDCFLAGIGLALQQTDYGRLLLRESLDRLRRRQLDVGLSADGVWRNAPFATHCEVLSTLTVLLGDLATTGNDALEPLGDAAKRMTLFVDAMLKSNGEPLPLDGTRGKSQASTLSGARRVLAVIGARPSKGKPAKGMAANRITETYVFRDAQYFVSHSTPKVTPESSQVAFHAKAGSAAKGSTGGLLLAFAHGPSNLLLGLVSRRKELTGVSKPNFWDPALRNGYQMGVPNAEEKRGSPNLQARIVKSWRGPAWAAARGVESYVRAELTRTVIHLKALHALLIVDEIAGGDEAALEQFWHLAPSLVPPNDPEGLLCFGVPDDGFLMIAFDGQPTVSMDRDASSSCVRRTLRVGQGVAGSLFQWTASGTPATLSLLREERENWQVSISAAGASLKISLMANELQVEEIAPGTDNFEQ